jgi:uncharacterized membrane protein
MSEPRETYSTVENVVYSIFAVVLVVASFVAVPVTCGLLARAFLWGAGL